MNDPVGSPQDVIQSPHVHHVLKVFEAYIRIQMRRPGYCQNIHAIPILELVRNTSTVLASASRDNDLIPPVISFKPRKKILQLFLPFRPINGMALELGIPACGANTILVKSYTWTLVRNSAHSAKLHFSGEAVNFLYIFRFHHQIILL